VRQKLDIAHKVLVEKISQVDVAQEYGVSQGAIGQIMHKMRKEPKAIGEIIAKSHAQQSSDASLS
jgi:predicted transcriptional regulator